MHICGSGPLPVLHPELAGRESSAPELAQVRPEQSLYAGFKQLTPMIHMTETNHGFAGYSSFPVFSSDSCPCRERQLALQSFHFP
jgi:hypothetical protein